jgi:hypothetical protein
MTHVSIAPLRWFAIFTRMRGKENSQKSISRKPHSPSLTDQDRLTRPPLVKRSCSHTVVVDRYAPGFNRPRGIIEASKHGLA